MSIVPINNRQSAPDDVWDHHPFMNLSLFNPFSDFPLSFPFPSALSRNFPSFSREILPFSVETQLNWTETATAHVFKAYLPGKTQDEVIVFADEEGFLQISTDDGKFMSRFKLPNNARVDQVTAWMESEFLVVFVAKEGADEPTGNTNQVRVVEIEGDD